MSIDSKKQLQLQGKLVPMCHRRTEKFQMLRVRVVICEIQIILSGFKKAENAELKNLEPSVLLTVF